MEQGQPGPQRCGPELFQRLAVRHVLDELPVAAFIKTDDLRIEYVNKAWTSISGISKEEAVGHTDLELFGGDGNDLASVAPTSRALLHLEGGAGTDTLKLYRGLARFLTPIPPRSATSGTYFFSNRRPVQFVSFEIKDIGITQPQP